jgi:hypothetical protein
MSIALGLKIVRAMSATTKTVTTSVNQIVQLQTKIKDVLDTLTAFLLDHVVVIPIGLESTATSRSATKSATTTRIVSTSTEVLFVLVRTDGLVNSVRLRNALIVLDLTKSVFFHKFVVVKQATIWGMDNVIQFVIIAQFMESVKPLITANAWMDTTTRMETDLSANHSVKESILVKSPKSVFLQEFVLAKMDTR